MDSLRLTVRALRASAIALSCALLFTALPVRAQVAYDSSPCFSPSDGQGRGVFPPTCDHGFTSHESAVILEGGLPAGVGLGGRMRLTKLTVTSASDGGALGGRTVNFSGLLKLELRGMNGLGRVNRRVSFPISGTFITAPQFAADTLQSFDFQLVSASGALPPNTDRDFATLTFRAGAANGLPGLGHATYKKDPSGEWACEAWLDLRYSMSFTGDLRGDLFGLAGTTVSELHTIAGRTTNLIASLPESGKGSIVWPPTTAEGRPGTTPGWFSSQRLAPARALLVRMNLLATPGADLYPGGTLGGELSVGYDQLVLEIIGEGAWSAYRRTVTLPVQTFVNWGPKADHQARQGRAADVHFLYGQISGDPDFGLLRVTGGSGFGMPSVGHTLAEKQANGDYQFDSQYDLTYRVEWSGASGGLLAGESGAVQATLEMQAGIEREGECEAPDNGSGTVAFPPPCASGFVGAPASLLASNGLPTGSPLLARVELRNLNVTSRVAGGALDGETQNMTGDVVLTLQGSGDLTGYARTLTLPATLQTVTEPWVAGAGPQHYEFLLNSLSAAVSAGDPDFTSLTILGGEGASFHSAGFTSYRPKGNGRFDVESSLDFGYRLAFAGKVGSLFEGRSGSTDTRAVAVAGSAPIVLAAPPRPSAGTLHVSEAMPNPTRGPLLVTFELPRAAHVSARVLDIMGRQVRLIEDGERASGVQAIAWDGHDALGRRAAPGLYMVRLELNGERFARRVMVTN